MDDVLKFVGKVFTTRPMCLLAWPAMAMLVGALVGIFVPKVATRLATTPRTMGGLVGLVTAPFAHVNWAHFSANLPPFLVLGWLVLRRGEGKFVEVAVMIAVAQGALLWLFGRRAAHVGMSRSAANVAGTEGAPERSALTSTQRGQKRPQQLAT